MHACGSLICFVIPTQVRRIPLNEAAVGNGHRNVQYYDDQWNVEQRTQMLLLLLLPSTMARATQVCQLTSDL